MHSKLAAFWEFGWIQGNLEIKSRWSWNVLGDWTSDDEPDSSALVTKSHINIGLREALILTQLTLLPPEPDARVLAHEAEE